MSKKTKLKVNAGDRVFLSLNYIFIICSLLVVLYPIVYIISASFSSPQAVGCHGDGVVGVATGTGVATGELPRGRGRPLKNVK